MSETDSVSPRRRITAEDERRERQRLALSNSDVQAQNCRGGWVPTPPEPMFVGWRLRKCLCDCGDVFPDRLAYRGHYALVHILGLLP